MSLDKTLVGRRRKVDIDNYDVADVLPSYFAEKYPNLITFLEKYYDYLEEEDSPTESLNDLLMSRDVRAAKEELLTYIASELYLGKTYFENFSDKRSSLENSNLLYRSKGTKYSIQQFFKIFYNIEIDVLYGKDELFFVGDPARETLEYTSTGADTGRVFSFKHYGDLEVYVAGDDSIERALRIDVDYTVDYNDNTVFLSKGQDPLVPGDTIYTYLATNGYLPSSSVLKIIVEKSRSTLIGADLQDKRIHNDKFYQLYALMIQSELSQNIWKEAYKNFVHPAGMYLASKVQLVSVINLGLGPQPSGETVNSFVLEGIAPVITSDISSNTSITELSPDSDGYIIRNRVNDLVKFGTFTITEFNTQYPDLNRADRIEARTLDDSDADLSNTINLLDENLWNDSDQRTTI